MTPTRAAVSRYVNERMLRQREDAKSTIRLLSILSWGNPKENEAAKSTIRLIPMQSVDKPTEKKTATPAIESTIQLASMQSVDKPTKKKAATPAPPLTPSILPTGVKSVGLRQEASELEPYYQDDTSLDSPSDLSLEKSNADASLTVDCGGPTCEGRCGILQNHLAKKCGQNDQWLWDSCECNGS